MFLKSPKLHFLSLLKLRHETFCCLRNDVDVSYYQRVWAQQNASSITARPLSLDDLHSLFIVVTSDCCEEIHLAAQLSLRPIYDKQRPASGAFFTILLLAKDAKPKQLVAHDLVAVFGSRKGGPESVRYLSKPHRESSMSLLQNVPNRKGYRARLSVNKERKDLWIGKLNARQRREYESHLGALLDSHKTGASPNPGDVEWGA